MSRCYGTKLGCWRRCQVDWVVGLPSRLGCWDFSRRLSTTVVFVEQQILYRSEDPDAHLHMTERPEIAQSGGCSFSYTKPLIQTELPSGRGGCSVCCADGKLIVFGGHYFEGGDEFTYLGETWVLDVEKLAWHKIKCAGQIPSPRYGHSAQIVGSRLFIFGGKGENGIMYRDVFFLDLAEWVWVPVQPVVQGPQPRFFHASCLVGRKIVVHGGWDGETETYNDLWIFDTDKFAWLEPRSSGFGPGARYGHSMTLTDDGRIIILGGCELNAKTGVPRYLNDVRSLQTQSMVWIRPAVHGPVISGRFGHTSVQLGSKIAIFGGWGKGGCQSSTMINNPSAHSVQLFDVKTMTFLVPRRLGKKVPKHMYSHGCCRAEGSSALLCFGGFDGRQASNDFSILNFDLGE